MKLDNNSKNTLNRLFIAEYVPGINVNVFPKGNYASNGIFNRFWQIESNGDTLECPVLFKNKLMYALQQDSALFEDKKTPIIYPLCVSEDVGTCRSGETIIKATLENPKITTINTNKGDRYYIGKGIVFDDQFQILMLCTEVFLKTPSSIFGYELNRDAPYICYIHPKVFSREDLFSKTILKKIVPFYLEEMESSKVKVVIEDMTKKVLSPVSPDITIPNLQETLNNLLKERVEDIMEGVFTIKYI